MTAVACSHPLADYGFRAVVDWVELRVTLAGPSQFRHVRDRVLAANPQWGKKLFVQGEDEDASHTATSFVFRIQNPRGPDHTLSEAQTARRPGDPLLTEDSIQIVGVEVALDAYPRTPEARAGLAGAAAYLWRNHGRPPQGTTRICHLHHGETAFQPKHIQAALATGHSVNTGDRDAPHCARHYVKTYDTTDGNAYTPLPEEEHRARAEVTLTGIHAPFRTIDGWRSFRFETLAPLLNLRRMNPTTDPMLNLLREATRAGGQPAKRRGATYHRLNKPGTVADAVANDRIRAALRALTRQQRGTRPRS